MLSADCPFGTDWRQAAYYSVELNRSGAVAMGIESRRLFRGADSVAGRNAAVCGGSSAHDVDDPEPARRSQWQ
jgi:hypothetical protein